MDRKRLLWALMFVLIGVGAGLLIAARFDISSTAQSQQAFRPQAQSSGASLEGMPMEDAVINVADRVGKAVVSITVEQVAKVKGGVRRFNFGRPNNDLPFNENDPFRRFFDEFFGEMPEREFKRMGVGSGVIIDAEGYILTNQHVVDEASKVTVILPDGREFKAEVKGQDSRSDLAVIKINAKNLPFAVLGDSDILKIGQWVVAIGNPFGLAVQNPEPTVTTGVISALHRTLGRTLGRDRNYNDLIQTDAAINPGNSGGPLVNLKGEVVGINVAIFSTSGGYQGIGFAVPVNSAKRVISRLIEGKNIEYGWLGVTVQNLSDDLAQYFGLKEKNGVLVAGVLKNGPAEKAGIKKGDILIRFDNKPVPTVKDLLSIVDKTEVNRKVKIQGVRDKKDLTFEVTIGTRPQDVEKQLQEEQTGTGEPGGVWRGLRVSDIDAPTARRFGIREKEGVVVMDVDSGSAADESDIVPGDVIMEMNRQKVRTKADFDRIAHAARGDVLLGLSRGFVVLKEGSEK